MTQRVLPIAPNQEIIFKAFEALKNRAPEQRNLSAKARMKRLDALYKEIWKRTGSSQNSNWYPFMMLMNEHSKVSEATLDTESGIVWAKLFDEPSGGKYLD